MNVVKKILLGVAALVVLLCLVGLALPSSYKVQRSVEIAAPMIKVYPLVYDPKAWVQWGVWNRRDPAMKVSYSGAPAGVGAQWAWISKSEGNGRMEITQAEFDKSVAYQLSIEGWDGKFNGRIDFAQVGPNVKVTWTGEGDVGLNPVSRWFVVFMDKLLGPDFEGSLANLKTVAERKE
ncbi:MAG: SRPBCC family protein [Betaproteobacteria bacterium]|nr:SRPBCC family protein [Betaproteobacteria bacterium]